VILVLARHHAGRPPVDLRLRTRDLAQPDGLRRRRPPVHAGTLAAAWTLPAHASLFTGMYPSRHGAIRGGFLPGRSIDGHRRVAFPLPEERVTLAEALRDRGYQTAAFAANFSISTRILRRGTGFGSTTTPPASCSTSGHWSTSRAVRPASVSNLSQRARDQRRGARLARTCARWPARSSLRQLMERTSMAREPPYDRWSQPLEGAPRARRTNLYTHAVRDFTDASAPSLRPLRGQLSRWTRFGEPGGVARARPLRDGTRRVTATTASSRRPRAGGAHRRMLYEPLRTCRWSLKLRARTGPRGRTDTPSSWST